MWLKGTIHLEDGEVHSCIDYVDLDKQCNR